MLKNMTSGSPMKLILYFMLPLLAGNLFQQFYNMADTFIVGRVLGSTSLAAVGSTGSLMFLILGFAFGATSGLTMVTSRRFGAGDMAAVRNSFFINGLLSLAISAVLTSVSVPLTRPILAALRTPDDIIEQAHSYIVVIFAGIAASMLFNLASSVLRAVGDSRTPLIFLVAACLLNIGLDYLLILTFGMGVSGAAVATIISQLMSGLACLVYIRVRLPELWPTRKDMTVTSEDLWDHIRLGIPMGFQMSIISIGAIIVQFALNVLGSVAVAGFTAAQKISALATLPLMSFGVTMGTYTAQNYGAGKPKRIVSGFFQCALMSVGFSIAMGIINFTLGGHMAGIFLNDSDTAAAMAHEVLKIEGFFYWSLSLLFLFRNSLQGLGQSFIPTLAGIIELIMRGISAAVLTRFIGFTGVGLAGPLAWLGAFIVLGIAFTITILRMRRDFEDASPPESELTGTVTAEDGISGDSTLCADTIVPLPCCKEKLDNCVNQ